MISKIEDNFENKQKFAIELQKRFKDQFMRMISQKTLQFLSEQQSFCQNFDYFLKHSQFKELFAMRVDRIILKVHDLMISKLKTCRVGIKWVVDFQCYEKNIELLEQFKIMLYSLVNPIQCVYLVQKIGLLQM